MLRIVVREREREKKSFSRNPTGTNNFEQNMWDDGNALTEGIALPPRTSLPLPFAAYTNNIKRCNYIILRYNTM